VEVQDCRYFADTPSKDPYHWIRGVRMRQYKFDFYRNSGGKFCLFLLVSCLSTMIFPASLKAQKTDIQTLSSYYLFHPNSIDDKIQPEYIPRQAQTRSPLPDRQNYLSHESSNPLLKLWLEKEIKKHKNR